MQNTTTCTCPLCDGIMEYKQYSKYWTCLDCPAILFEYVNLGDARDVADAIEKS
jgi:hypothetical protein